ncbi:hypothetical protein SAMN05216474_2480 [Lishizhenia tianjinensis]|uniref:Uncharacterized protein n=1 Tax=Lishizhenia tianjinensis TaxID=477690 RepID=A0A1I7B252_9FLAO|nr:hypothetical protein [Lishizhenia tianjinensis]SFT81263.1 hypothetical protein SAMN05216474_2480 [Lishizhenia tianjinensis]
MNSSIEFTFHEINALNKLLGQIKSEAHLIADDINFFAMSPFIISVFEKIHKEYKNQIRTKYKNKKFKATGPEIDLSLLNDFQLTDQRYVGERIQRISELSQPGKDYIKGLDKEKREEYCDSIFAPFKPTEKQRQEILAVLASISNTK